MTPIYKLNEDYFSYINSEDKAYFLGFLYADGYIHDKRKYVYLTLQEDDKEILEKFQICLETNKPLLRIDRSNEPNTKTQWRLAITRKKIYNDLKRLGLYQKKSLTLTPDKLSFDENLIRHFIRGYFDGDGSFSWYRPKNRNTIQSCLSIVCTKEFCEYFKIIFQNIEVKSSRGKRFNNKQNCFNFIISGNRQVLKSLKFIYENSSFYLKRKYTKYIKLQGVLDGLNKQKYKRYELLQINEDNIILNRFFSYKDAANFHNVATTTFVRKIKKENYLGFKWQINKIK